MDNNYRDMYEEHENYKRRREEKKKIDSSDRLSRVIKKKIQTTMIGAISSVEEHLGFLWNHDSQEELNEDQKALKEIFQTIRSEILDRGNDQARNVDVELSHYDIEWKKFSLKLPVRPGNKES